MDLLIIGPSARAAAHSALRAGLTPSTADLFRDVDLAAVARSTRVSPDGYPATLLDAALSLPRCPWIYTGGIENHPDEVARLAADRPLWGNNPEVLRRVRSPVLVREALDRASLPALDVRDSPDGLPRDGSWLRKPLRSSGGLGIEPLVTATPAGADGSSYYQRFMPGIDISAVFVAGREGVVLAGVTRQWVGRPGESFGYRGSLAPWPLGTDREREIVGIGRCLAEAFGLAGLFGVDLILAGGHAWVVEVNPRYTASVEVIELATGRSLLDAHARACQGLPPAYGGSPAGRFVAKEVVYATGATSSILSDGAAGQTFSLAEPFSVPEVADVPPLGTCFVPGEPVLTVFGEANTPKLAEMAVVECRKVWERRLRPARD